jgi:hypothetical protein
MAIAEDNTPLSFPSNTQEKYYGQNNYGSTTTTDWQNANMSGGGLGGGASTAIASGLGGLAIGTVIGNIIGSRRTNNPQSSNNNNWSGGEGGGDGYDIVGDTGESEYDSGGNDDSGYGR